MALVTGQLASIGVPELFRAIADGRKTGRLVLTRDGHGKLHEARVYFRDGDAYHARLVGTGVQLGKRLVSAGLATHQEVEDALAVQKEENGARRVGEIMVDDGLVPRERMEEIVKEQIEDTIFEVLRWEGGTFLFEPGVSSEEDVWIEVSVENLVMEGARRFREWHQITRRVPTLEAVPRFADDGDGAVEVALTPEEWAFVSALDGHRTVAQLASACGFTDLEAARTVFGLVTAGLLDVDLPEGTSLPVEDAGIESAFEELERAFEEATSRSSEPGRPTLEELTGVQVVESVPETAVTIEELFDQPTEANADVEVEDEVRVEDEATEHAVEEASAVVMDRGEDLLVAEVQEPTSASIEETIEELATQFESQEVIEVAESGPDRYADFWSEGTESSAGPPPLPGDIPEPVVAEPVAAAAEDFASGPPPLPEVTEIPDNAEEIHRAAAEVIEVPAAAPSETEVPQTLPAAPIPSRVIAHDLWGTVSPKRNATTEPPAEPVEEIHEGSVAKLFAELATPLDDTEITTMPREPEPEPEPEPVTPEPEPAAINGNGNRGSTYRLRPIDPDVDTSALIRELSAFATDDEDESQPADWNAPVPTRAPEDKGRGFFGRRRR